MTEDHVHGLGQVVHGAISRHCRVRLVTRSEEIESGHSVSKQEEGATGVLCTWLR